MIETKFKETEVGRIPEIWQSCEVGILCDVNTGSKNTQDKVEDGKYLFFVRSQTVEHINTFSYDCEAVLTAGDGVGTGKVFHYVNGKFEVHQRVYIMNNFSTELDGKYFFFVFSQRFYDRVMQMTAKSSVDSVRKDMINEMQIPLPPLPEQRRIASALSSVDELISSLDTLIEKKRNIKLGAMQQLLTGKKRLNGFNQPWVEKSIDDICERLDNLRIPISESNRRRGSTPYYGANGIQDFVEGYTHDGEYILLAEDGANSLSDYPIRYVMGKIWVNNHAHVLQAKKMIADNKFLSYSFKNIDFESNIVGCGRAKLNSQTLMLLKVLIPSTIEEQRAIAAVLTNMDDEIAALEQNRDKYITVKQGMMQQLLTGKIRLIG